MLGEEGHPLPVPGEPGGSSPGCHLVSWGIKRFCLRIFSENQFTLIMNYELTIQFLWNYLLNLCSISIHAKSLYGTTKRALVSGVLPCLRPSIKPADHKKTKSRTVGSPGQSLKQSRGASAVRLLDFEKKDLVSPWATLILLRSTIAIQRSKYHSISGWE